MPGASRKQPRVVALIYGGIAGALLLVIATVALVFAPPAAPSVAEYAPQASKTVDEASANQSSRFGSGGVGGEAFGGCADPRSTACSATMAKAPAQAAAASTSTSVVIKKNRVRRCVGNPPRQTEDRQSPPCVNYFDGDNGGATARGVTRDEIRVALGTEGSSSSSANETTLSGGPQMQAWTNYFNNRFEFYGRTLRFVGLPSTQDPQVEAEAAAERNVFAAVTSARNDDGATAVYLRNLARLGVVGIANHPRVLTTSELTDLGPYAWAFSPAFDEVERATASFICSSLANRSATHAGAVLSLQPRKFAIEYLHTNGTNAPVLDVLHDGLRRCGIAARNYELASGSLDDHTKTLAAMQADGVTSIIPLLESPRTTDNMLAAESNGYEPEWVLAGFADQDNEWQYGQGMPAGQRGHVFGIFALNKLLPVRDESYFTAAREGGLDPSNDLSLTVQGDGSLYKTLLALASALQAAGPNLNAETLAHGLQSLRFPNPDAGRLPEFQGSVGFANDHTMIDDVAVVWWSDATQGPRNPAGKGGWCYLGGGTRFPFDHVPDVSADLFSVTTCR